jgi:hypothetical protein
MQYSADILKSLTWVVTGKWNSTNQGKPCIPLLAFLYAICCTQLK